MKKSKKYAIVDLETTGGTAKYHRITEIAIVVHNGEKIENTYSSLVNPERSIPPEITKITGITNEMVRSAPKFYEIAKRVIELTEGCVFVAHNVRFDYSFLQAEFKSLGYTFTRKLLCTVRLSRKSFPGLRSYSLENLIRHFKIDVKNRHQALDDTLATVVIFEKILKGEFGLWTVEDMINQGVKEAKLPKGLTLNDLHSLPSTSGVYYFYNRYGRILYVGKAKNIKKRVFQHFQKMTEKSEKLYQLVSSVSFEETGNELIALLLEAREIKRHQPEINKALKRKDFTYFLSINTELEYHQLELLKLNKKNQINRKPLVEYSNKQQGKQHFYHLVKDYELCIKHTNEANVSLLNCACLGNCKNYSATESNGLINQLKQDLDTLFDEDFLLLLPGRNVEEKAFILVENGRYQGYTFLDIQLDGSHFNYPSSIADSIRPEPYYPIMNKLIWSYIKNNNVEMIKLF